MKFQTILSLAIATGSVLLTDAVCFAEEGGSINPLALSKDMAFWTFVIFVITLLILGKFAWKPIVEGLDKREQGIADQIAQAAEKNAQADEALEKYKAQLADAKAEAEAIIANAKQTAEKQGQIIVENAKKKAVAEEEKAKAELALLEKAALQELADKSTDLALVLAGKICQKKLDKTDHAKLINQEVEKFSKQAL